MTVSNFTRMADNSQKSVENKFEKGKLLVINNFSFSHLVFKTCNADTCKKQGLFGRELNLVSCGRV